MGGGRRREADLTLWMRGESLKELVEDTLFDMHVETSESHSFPVDEIARRAGLPVELARRILERLRAEGKVGRRAAKKPRYYLRRDYLNRRLREAGLETEMTRRIKRLLGLQ